MQQLSTKTKVHLAGGCPSALLSSNVAGKVIR